MAPVINFDRNRAYPPALEALRKEGQFAPQVIVRQCST
jgi:hypothetical protein